MAAATLSEDAAKKIRRIKKARGKVCFCKQNRLDGRTFDDLCAGKFVRSDVIAKIELALVDMGPRRPSADTVLRVVQAAYGINQRALETPSRKAPFDEARMIAAMLLFEDAKMSKPEISKLLCYSDHTGAYVAIRSIQGTLAVDDALKQRVAEIRRMLQAATDLAAMAQTQTAPDNSTISATDSCREVPYQDKPAGLNA
jgi:hypothetical protein